MVACSIGGFKTSQRWVSTPGGMRQPIIWQNCYTVPKMHENETIWTERMHIRSTLPGSATAGKSDNTSIVVTFSLPVREKSVTVKMLKWLTHSKLFPQIQIMRDNSIT